MLINQLNKVGIAALAITSCIAITGCTSTELASIKQSAIKDAETAEAAEIDLQETEAATETAAVAEDEEKSVKPLALVSTDSSLDSLFPNRPGTPEVRVNIKTRSETPPPEIASLIKKYSRIYGVPEKLVHHVAHRESTYNPAAYSNGNYGLMQIRYRTAKGMGYQGKPDGLFDAETNIKYATKYLRNAWIVAEKDEKAADWLYRTGYYYEAKRKGKLGQLKLMNSDGLH